MNEIAGIYVKNRNLNGNKSIEAAFSFFKQQYNTCHSEIHHDDMHIVVASKGGFIKPRQHTPNHILAVGGYLLNEPGPLHEEEYLPADFHGKFLWVNICKTTGKTTMYNDVLGHFPVYYYNNSDCFCFASDLNFILHLDIDKSLSPQHIADYFTLGSTLPGTTLFKHINLLPPSSHVSIGQDKKVVFDTYTLPCKQERYASASESASALIETMQNVMNAHIGHFKKLSITLTGGIDTRFLASYVRPDWDVEFVTISSPQLPDDNNSEILLAQQIAKHINKPHRVLHSTTFPVPQHFDTYYFTDKNLCEERTQFISGLFGSEVLKLQVFNILNPHLSEVLIKNLYPKPDISSYYETHPLVKNKFWFAEAAKGFRLRPMLDNDLKQDFNRHLDTRRKELTQNIKNNKHKFIYDWLTRTYITNHYGGSRGGWLHPTDFFRNFLLPFADQKIYSVVANIPLSQLGVRPDSVYFEIYKAMPKKIRETETNSGWPLCDGKVFKHSQQGKHPLEFRKNNDHELLLHYTENSKIYDLHIFNKKKLQAKLSTNRWLRDSFIDLSVWLDFIKSM